uniref:Adenylate cyclase (EC) n=1 Tax=uncultured Thiotrichaceae bacterium TaxID=298394 RepID=A0A6S6SX37_9GAMM|nr:MAG: Adenylate cyclase (EC [uncultured Thiotrichaceae bacterium]
MTVITLMLLSCQPQQSDSNTPVVEKGILDLNQWDFDEKNNMVELDGEWVFYWQHLLTPDDFSQALPPHSYITVPSSWNKHEVNGQPVGSDGYATYRLKVKLAHHNPDQLYALKLRNLSSAYSLWINDKHLLDVGKVGEMYDEILPLYKPQIITFSSPSAELNFTLQVANFHHRRGGAWNSIELGTEEQIRARQRSLDHFDVFILGSMMMMAFYHFGLFSLRRLDRSTLYFGLFCLIIGIRSLFYRDLPISILIPDISWVTVNKMRYLTTFVALPTFLMFVQSLYPKEFSKGLLNTIIATATLFCGIVIFTSVKVSSYTMLPYQIITVLSCLYICYVLFRAAQQQREDIWWFIAGFTSFFLAVLNDVLTDMELLNSMLLIPFGLFLFIFSQAFILSRRFSRAFSRIEKLTQAYQRFVPVEFLSNLKQDDIVDVQLGDYVEQTMSVMFTDIRAFTSMAENMTPQETFNFLNSYLSRMEPAINNHNGFIDKYIGDEIMALFGNSANDAVNAAIAMLLKLKEYNIYRSYSHYPPVQIGVGINTGELMLGTIGARSRMEGTVISDAVNLASRIERLTRQYNSPLLISGYTLKALTTPGQYNIRFIDRVQVDGKSEWIAIYEVFNADSLSLIKEKLGTQANFEQAIKHYHAGEYQQALALFQSCLKAAPEDTAAEVYVNWLQQKITETTA